MEEPKTKRFTAHDNLIYLVIERQAGTIAKSALEAVMNSNVHGHRFYELYHELTRRLPDYTRHAFVQWGIKLRDANRKLPRKLLAEIMQRDSVVTAAIMAEALPELEKEAKAKPSRKKK